MENKRTDAKVETEWVSMASRSEGMKRAHPTAGDDQPEETKQHTQQQGELIKERED